MHYHKERAQSSSNDILRAQSNVKRVVAHRQDDQHCAAVLVHGPTLVGVEDELLSHLR